MKECKIGFVGVGEMGSAILQGALNAKVLSPSQVGVCNRSPEKLLPYTHQGCIGFSDIPSLTKACEMVLLAVKPQDFTSVLPMVKEGITADTVIISIAAGITAKQIQEAMGFPCKVVLAMPNTPLLLGKGATGMSKVEETTEEEFQMAQSVFSATGVVEVLEPHQMAYVIPLSGSSPAYLYYIADILVKHAVNCGISEEVAMNLFCQSMIGSAAMLQESGHTATELVEMVSSPGGATIAGMEALKENGFKEAIDLAFDACISRAEELSKLGNTHAPNITVEIAEYGSKDYEAILKLREQVLREPLGLKNSEKDVEDDSQAIHFMVKKDGKLVGTGQLSPVDAFSVQVRQVAVDPNTRQSGIGKLLMRKMEEYAWEQEFQIITLNARETALGFYSILGYQQRGALFLMNGLPHMSMYKEFDKNEEI